MIDDNPRVLAARLLVNEAEKRLQQHNRKVRDLIVEAENKIHAEHRADKLEIETAVRQFKQELADTIDREAKETPHPLEGRRMVRYRTNYDQNRTIGAKGDIYMGVFETVTQASKFRSNMTYNRPRPGDHIVRLLNAKGEPSLIHEIYREAYWKPEETKA